jgi:hypothetical protein
MHPILDTGLRVPRKQADSTYVRSHRVPRGLLLRGALLGPRALGHRLFNRPPHAPSSPQQTRAPSAADTGSPETPHARPRSADSILAAI